MIEKIGVDPAKYIRLLWIGGGVLLFDQITKWIIMDQLTLHGSIPVIQGIFNITHIQNPGGAFGFLARESDMIRAIVFLLVSSIALVVILYFYHTTPQTHRMLSTGFALIFGGAVGNLVDRVRFGKVIDFLDFYIGCYHWPAFNIADSAICVGVVIFSFHVLFKKMPD